MTSTVTVPSSSTFEEISTLLSRTFNCEPAELQFSYVDDEGDSIRINSDMEWQYAVKYLNGRQHPNNSFTVRNARTNVIADVSISVNDCETKPTESEQQPPVTSNDNDNSCSSSSSNSSPQMEVDSNDEGYLHSAICDKCNVPIRGIRYKCKQCDDFDFCSSCYQFEATSPVKFHSQDHSFHVITIPHHMNFFVHRAICDNCRTSITGLRFKCRECPDFDFCKECYDSHLVNPLPCHPQAHQFMEIPPGGFPRFCARYFRNCRRPRYMPSNWKSIPCTFPGATPVAPTTATTTIDTNTTTITRTTDSTDNVSVTATQQPVENECHSASCDNCYSQVRGIRWKCSQCEDFDFCDACYSSYENGNVIHSKDHVFMRVRKAAPYPLGSVFMPQGEFYGSEDKRSISTLQRTIEKLNRLVSVKLSSTISELESKLDNVEVEKNALELELQVYRRREQQEQQRIEAERQEKERLEAEQQELIRREIERKEQERREIERLEAARLENEQKRMLLEEEARCIAENMKAVEQAAKKDVEKEAKERKKFEKELALLAEMGFNNELQNLALLNRHRDVNTVLQALLQ